MFYVFFRFIDKTYVKDVFQHFFYSRRHLYALRFIIITKLQSSVVLLLYKLLFFSYPVLIFRRNTACLAQTVTLDHAVSNCQTDNWFFNVFIWYVYNVFIELKHALMVCYLARSANLPEGLYIWPMFFSLFCIFLMVDFLDPVAENLMDRSSPKFLDW